MPHYPEQRLISRLTVVQRDVLLPELTTGAVETMLDKRVDIRDVIARGIRPGYHTLVDVARYFNKPSDRADQLALVKAGDVVEQITPIAGRNPERGKRLFAPVPGRVAYVGGGLIVIEQKPEVTTLEAGLRGIVTAIHSGRGATIETTGAALQGVWGNGRRTAAALRLEPETGIESTFEDEIDLKYMGVIIVTRRKLSRFTLEAIADIGFGGVVAPSMDYTLIDLAMSIAKPIMLTEGFGSISMNRAMLSGLADLEGQHVLLDAYLPRAGDHRRPEVIVNAQARQGETPSRPNVMLTLRPGLNVRITREPYVGQSGQVVNLLKSPILVDNGLRLPCAQITLAGGETVTVPIANLEVIGR